MNKPTGSVSKNKFKHRDSIAPYRISVAFYRISVAELPLQPAPQLRLKTPYLYSTYIYYQGRLVDNPTNEKNRTTGGGSFAFQTLTA